VTIRGSSSGNEPKFRLTCQGRLIEEFDDRMAYREIHKGAIFRYGGETYQVRFFLKGQRSQGRFATPADFPLHDCSPYRGLHVRRESVGFCASFKGRFPSYKSWTEDEKVSWIEKELMGRRPLVGRSPPHLQRCFERPALTRPFRDARRFPSPRL
jgi:ATP-dependent helicase YprA (DUF1998 family)